MKVSRRSRVQNLRDIWKKEVDFSNWLASEDGIALLAEDIGVSIENATRESRPGDFPCDIRANVVGEEDHVVVIENQFGSTDHDHLGKLLTYAAVHRAMTGIWIAERAADDHRAVIDWLNANTPDTCSFYLAEIKAFRIEDSPIAPILDVLCRPNEATRPKQSGRSEGDMERRAWRKAFWEDVHIAIRATRPAFNLQKASGDHWNSISIGRSGFAVQMLLTPAKKSIAVELTVAPKGWKQSAFDQLFEKRIQFESELGATLDWRAMEDKQSSRIVLEAQINPEDDTNRNDVAEWFAKWSSKFYAVFRDPVLALKG